MSYRRGSLDGAGCAGTEHNWLSGVDRQLDEKWPGLSGDGVDADKRRR